MRKSSLLVISFFTLAAAAGERRPIDTSASTQIFYGAPSWNTDSSKIDSAYLILRDKLSGRFVQIQLEETEPDSSRFRGIFSLQLDGRGEIVPEIYVPPADLRGNDPDNKKVYELIAAGKLPRKPTIWKKNAKGEAILDVYDTREQGEAALLAYQEETRMAARLQKKTPLKAMTGEQARVAATADLRKRSLEKMALEATRADADRARLEQIAKSRADEMQKDAAAQGERKRLENNARAAVLAQEGQVLYNAQDFSGAGDKFKAALALNPMNTDYLFKYGVTLYRNERFNEAFVILKLATVPPELLAQRAYYMALCLYRQKDLRGSENIFAELAKGPDPVLAPSSEFYRGVIFFVEEDYDAAKTSFEGVIDRSHEPALDRQAEEYLDRIAAASEFKRLREKRFTLTGTLGYMYDSNVLLSPGNLPGNGAPSNQGDSRILTVASLQYRPVFNEHHEFSPSVTANLTNSFKNTSAPADPFIYTLLAPYSYKNSLDAKAWMMTVTPGYELLYMDPTATGKKALELASYFVMLDNTFVMGPRLVSSYLLEYRNDTSNAADSVGPNDISANQYTFRTTQTIFLDQARRQALLPTLDYVLNPAKGSDQTYNRYDLGVTFVRPFFWASNMNLGFNFYQMNYTGTSNPSRVDHDYQVSLGFTKPIRQWVIWGLNGTYTANNSTDPNFQYDKYLVMTTATFLTSF